jgi:hypothetical protein
MRIKTMAALGIATAAVGTGLAFGGAAYAGNTDTGSQPASQIVLQDERTSTSGYAPEDCPEKNGAGAGTGSAAPQESF